MERYCVPQITTVTMAAFALPCDNFATNSSTDVGCCRAIIKSIWIADGELALLTQHVMHYSQNALHYSAISLVSWM